MSSGDRQPSRDELLAMAYVDGELDEDSRRELEARLRTEPPLAREIAELQELNVLARQVAPPEPMDFEWERLGREGLHRGGTSFGLLAIAVAVLGLLGWGAVGLARSDMDATPKLLLLLLLGSLTLLFALTLRARLRTLPLDPYTKVQR